MRRILSIALLLFGTICLAQVVVPAPVQPTLPSFCTGTLTNPSCPFPDTSTYTTTAATSCTDATVGLQKRLNDAATACAGGTGQIVTLDHTLSCSGHYTINAVCPAGKWLILESDAAASLPAHGTRVHDSDAANMPTIMPNSGTISEIDILPSSSGIWFRGIRFLAASSGTFNHQNPEIRIGNGAGVYVTSAVRASGTVTITTNIPGDYSNGSSVAISGSGAGTFAGIFTIANLHNSPAPYTFTYAQAGGDETITPTTGTAYASLQGSSTQQPDRILFEQGIIIGGFEGNGSINSKAAIELQCTNCGIIDSRIEQIHGTNALSIESHGVQGWNGAGPFIVHNNYIEAAGMCSMIGGANTPIPNLVPSDWTITQNYCNKPETWNPNDPSFICLNGLCPAQGGTYWSEKNVIEFKSGQRIYIGGNWIQNTWSGGQIGSGIVLNDCNGTSTNYQAWDTVNNVTIENNVLDHIRANAVSVARRGCGGGGLTAGIWAIKIHSNLITNLGGGNVGNGSQYLFASMNASNDPNNYCSDVDPTKCGYEFTHNTITPDAAQQVSSTWWWQNAVLNANIFPIAVHDNIFPLAKAVGATKLFSHYDNCGSSCYTATSWYNNLNYNFDNSYPPNCPATFAIGAPWGLHQVAGAGICQTDVTGVRFTNLAAGNYVLASNSPGHHAALDGTDVGANLGAMNTALGPDNPQLPGPDTVPPTVTITAPTAGSTVTGANVTVTGTCSDNLGCTSLVLKIDSTQLGADCTTTSPCSRTFNSNSYSNGAHTVHAIGNDDAGNGPVDITESIVVSNGSPVCSITGPSLVGSKSGTLTLTATGTPNSGSINNITFTLDGSNLPSAPQCANASCSWGWDTAGLLSPDGLHTLSCTCSDSDGANGICPNYNVSIRNAVVPRQPAKH